MDQILHILKNIEAGKAKLPITPPESVTARDVAIAQYIVDIYCGRGINDQNIMPSDMLNWFEGLSTQDAVFHLWNAWHRKM